MQILHRLLLSGVSCCFVFNIGRQRTSSDVSLGFPNSSCEYFGSSSGNPAFSKQSHTYSLSRHLYRFHIYHLQQTLFQNWAAWLCRYCGCPRLHPVASFIVGWKIRCLWGDPSNWRDWARWTILISFWFLSCASWTWHIYWERHY